MSRPSASGVYGSADSDTDRSAGSLDVPIGVVTDAANHLKTVAGSLGTPLEVHNPSDMDDDLNPSRNYLSAADLGILKATRNAEGGAPTCTMPPPSPPPPSPSSPSPVEALQESSNSGLTAGEVAGVAVGATIGGIVLLGIVGLILRSVMFKQSKPVFTCLEKAPTEKKAPPESSV